MISFCILSPLYNVSRDVQSGHKFLVVNYLLKKYTAKTMQLPLSCIVYNKPVDHFSDEAFQSMLSCPAREQLQVSDAAPLNVRLRHKPCQLQILQANVLMKAGGLRDPLYFLSSSHIWLLIPPA